MRCSKCSELVNERVSFPKLTFFYLFFSILNCDWLNFFVLILFVQFGLMIRRCNLEVLEDILCNLYEDTV